MRGSNLLIVTVGISMINEEGTFDGYRYLHQDNPYSGDMNDDDAIKEHFSKYFKFAEWVSLTETAPPQIGADPVLPGAGAEIRLLYFAHPKGWLSFHDRNHIILIAEDSPGDKAVVAAIRGALSRLILENKFPPAEISYHFFPISEQDPQDFLTGLNQLRTVLDRIRLTDFDNIYFGLLGGRKGLLTFLGMYYLQCRYTHRNRSPERFKGIIYLFEKANTPIIINADRNFQISTQLSRRFDYPLGPGN